MNSKNPFLPKLTGANAALSIQQVADLSLLFLKIFIGKDRECKVTHTVIEFDIPQRFSQIDRTITAGDVNIICLWRGGGDVNLGQYQIQALKAVNLVKPDSFHHLPLPFLTAIFPSATSY